MPASWALRNSRKHRTPHLGAGSQEPLDVGDVVAVVAAQQDVCVLAGLDSLGQRLQGALNTDVDDLLLIASGPGQRHGGDSPMASRGLDESSWAYGRWWR